MPNLGEIVLISESELIAIILSFTNHISQAPGHKHLYDEFDEIIHSLNVYRNRGENLTYPLASSIFNAVDSLLRENMEGQRPWSEGMETYFAKCMANSYQMMKEVSSFDNYRQFMPNGFCNKCLDMFIHMDKYVVEFTEYHDDKTYRILHTHFDNMACQAAEMFALTADTYANVQKDLLNNPDDSIFTWLLRGFSMSISPVADQILHFYTEDDEQWVQELAKKLLDERKNMQIDSIIL